MSRNIRTIVYESGYKRRIGFFRIWLVMIRNIIESRELIYQLFKRDFIAVYKQSFLGVTWIFVAPVLGIIQWLIMNAAGVLEPGETGVPYPAFVLLSMAIWGMVPGFFKAAMKTLEVAKGFILQVKFPHEALIAKQSAEYMANFIFSFTFSLIILLVYGVTFNWGILLFPVAVIPLFLFSAGLGLMFAIPNVISKEMLTVTDFIVNFMLFVTPVIYSPDIKVGLLAKIVKWNPLTYLVGAPRDLIIKGVISDVNGFLYSTALAFLLFMLSWRFFYLAEDKAIEKMI